MTLQPPRVVVIDDFQTHLKKRWPITCAGSNEMLIKTGALVEISATPDLVISVAGTALSQWQAAEQHSGDRMRTIDPSLECARHQVLRRGRWRKRENKIRDVIPDNAENHLPVSLRHYEHTTFSVTKDGIDYYVFAFVCIPDDADSSTDTLLLEVQQLQDGHGVGENSVHGGPPT